jgi:hypothetical protein
MGASGRRVVILALRQPRLARLLVRAGHRLPRTLRRSALEWQGRELTAGSFNRGDYGDALRAFGAPSFEFWPAPELVTLLPLGNLSPGEPLRGIEPAIRFVDGWFEAWDKFSFLSREVIDLGDRRFLLLHHLEGTGASSGVQISDQEEAQLWEFRHGALVRVRQWWTWDEALTDTGVSESTQRV